jgi:hypothetical protein
MSTSVSENTSEPGYSMDYTYVTTYKIENEELRKRGSIHSMPVIKCDTTQEDGGRNYRVFIRKNVYNIVCRLADVGDTTEQDYAQVCIIMSDDFTFNFKFRYNHSAKAFYDEMFAEVFLE